MHIKTTVTTVAVILVALTGCTSSVTPATPTPTTTVTTASARTVEYRTTGPKGATVSYVIADGSEQTTAKKKTWSKIFDHTDDFVIYSLAVTGNGISKSTVSCTIKVDGKTISHHKSDGLYATASCSGSGL